VVLQPHGPRSPTPRRVGPRRCDDRNLMPGPQPPPAGMHKKRKKHRQSSDYQCFSSVGVTGFEPATTRPPDDYYYSTDNADYLLVTYLLLLFGLIVGLITA
jgi:hypothetical protein